MGFSVSGMTTLTYLPQVFDVLNMQSAREVILTHEGAASADERWHTETPYVADLIGQSVDVSAKTVLIDYGCGIGRLAKELIDRHQCRVIGVDISVNMRALAVDYVRSDRFLSCSPDMLDSMVGRGFTADAAFSVWVLQHCFRPADDIARIYRALAPKGRLFVVNNHLRAVPTNEGWVNDGIDVRALLNSRFALTEEGVPLDDKMAPKLHGKVFWASFQKAS
jgi:SAM-dependent methyltransferase